MGLNPNHRRVLRGSAADEEQRHRQFSIDNEKRASLAEDASSQVKV